jgi:hypothetical protein
MVGRESEAALGDLDMDLVGKTDTLQELIEWSG